MGQGEQRDFVHAQGLVRGGGTDKRRSQLGTQGLKRTGGDAGTLHNNDPPASRGYRRQVLLLGHPLHALPKAAFYAIADNGFAQFALDHNAKLNMGCGGQARRIWGKNRGCALRWRKVRALDTGIAQDQRRGRDGH